MADITVTFFNNLDDGTLKVNWSMGSTEVFYHISFTRLQDRSNEVRSALQAMVDAGRDKTYDKYDELVRKLATNGNKFYDALLFGEKADDKVEATRARNWIAKHFRPGQDAVTFRLPSRIHFPWGLIYDQPVKDGDDPDELKKHFWCAKFSATVHYFVNRFEWTENPWPTEKFGLLFGADQDLWTATSLELLAAEKARLLTLLGMPEPKFKLDDLSKQWRAPQPQIPHGLLTFYCHANGNELSIGGTTLSANDFEEMFEHKTPAIDTSPPTLVFLAGCKTGVSELHKGFFKATAASGYCGFIGTEVKVPDIFTLRFVTHFLDRFFSTGESIGQVMNALRMQHWPLSLVFSMCCPINLRLEPSAGGMKSDPLNLSNERISTG
ncbi:MAG: CHAT domain-containing protein [Bradyrhizobium sp.]|uniref:CHAT domain-containing protein n=1 Tax=Bradyrhizobium sp. TaxID=376 RepID=UPI0027307F47|nr:CHAT domain-containing protein [Bradyrhizobium sp.]MDP1865408.1 CHAT domain-containing protein [Bradyrhizobium sp.]